MEQSQENLDSQLDIRQSTMTIEGKRQRKMVCKRIDKRVCGESRIERGKALDNGIFIAGILRDDYDWFASDQCLQLLENYRNRRSITEIRGGNSDVQPNMVESKER